MDILGKNITTWMSLKRVFRCAVVFLVTLQIKILKFIKSKSNEQFGRDSSFVNNEHYQLLPRQGIVSQYGSKTAYTKLIGSKLSLVMVFPNIKPPLSKTMVF